MNFRYVAAAEVYALSTQMQARAPTSCEPLQAFAFLPETLLSLGAVVLDRVSFSMLNAVLPLPIVCFTVWPRVGSLPVLHVVDVLSFVRPPVRPAELSLAVHAILHPLALVSAAVTPSVGALALDVVLLELAFVVGAVGPRELARAVLPPIHVGALVA